MIKQLYLYSFVLFMFSLFGRQLVYLEASLIDLLNLNGSAIDFYWSSTLLGFINLSFVKIT